MEQNRELVLLLDVDGPVASPETRTVPAPVLEGLVEAAHRGIPVVFNTGRSAEFLLGKVAAPLRTAGLPPLSAVFGVAEKAAVSFTFTDIPEGTLPGATRQTGVPSWIDVREDMALPDEAVELVRSALDEHGRGTMFWDETKLAMASMEMTVGADRSVFEPARDAVAAAVTEGLRERGLTGIRVEPTVISVDVEDVRSGKALGARRARTLLREAGLDEPRRWVTAGDSPSDYAMADELQARGQEVVYVDVRPGPEGVPAKPYPVLTAADLAAQGYGSATDIDDAVGASLLHWALAGLPGLPSA